MKKIIILSFSLIFTLQAFAWGQKGHRIIAQVAYSYLRPSAIKHVDAVLGTHGMVYWANWPDEIKSDPTLYSTSFDWHFQDMDSGLSDSVVVSYWSSYPTVGGNLFRVLDSITSVLQNDNSNHDALVFLVHLTGDWCCPVHMAHIEDRGGNAIKMRWFSNNTNMHTVWDTNLIESQGYSYSEYAQRLVDIYGDRKKEIEQMSRAQITTDTYHITDSIYSYQSHWDNNSYHYIYHWRNACEWQLYVAGVRLAQLLNSLY